MKKTVLVIISLFLLFACENKPVTVEHASWTHGSVVYEMNIRQLTPEGTFTAASSRLEIIRKMGVDVIWLMPIYPIGEVNRKGTLGSYYAIRDYCDINPEFGTLEDFDNFLAYAHSLGLKVIIDWVANHTAPDHAWVTEKPADWYVRDAEGNPVTEYDWTDISKLNYDCPQMREEMEKCMQFWLDRGIDGFRCDMASLIPADFWKNVITEFRAQNSNLYFLAEAEEPWLHEVGFDATYWWTLHHALNDIAQGKIDRDSLVRVINKSIKDYPKNAYRLSFTSNHDENSWSGTEFERMGDAWRACTVLAFTLPGAQPLLYTGQELGNKKRLEFFEKDPLPKEHWENLDNIKNIYSFYFDLLRFYHDHPCVQGGMGGSFTIVEEDEQTNDGTWLTYERRLGEDGIMVKVHLIAPFECKLSLL